MCFIFLARARKHRGLRQNIFNVFKRVWIGRNLVGKALDASEATSPIRSQQCCHGAPTEVRVAIGFIHKCVTTVLARLPGESSLAAVSN